MAYYGPGYSGPSKISYLFVDAGSLRGRLDNLFSKFFGSAKYNLSLLSLTHGYTKVFYYDAIPVRNDGEDETAYNARVAPQIETLEAAASIDRIHVYEGDVRKRRKRNEQKKVDVMIAVDMLTHTFRQNMHEATLLTGDNDFKPLVDALVHNGMFVTLWYPPGETSKELINAADIRKPLSMMTLKSLLDQKSQVLFDIPNPINLDPSIEPGTKLREWHEGGIRHVLNQEGTDYIVLRDGDSLNRLHIRNSNYELLVFFCKEAYDMNIPSA